MLKVSYVGTTHPSFMEKTFAGGSKTERFSNVFFLESFPLYGIDIRDVYPGLET